MTQLRYETVIRRHFTVTSVSGDEFLAMCKWHSDTSQGHLYLNGRSGMYICFSCGQKGQLDRLGMELPPVSTDVLRGKLDALRNPRPPQKFYPEGWLAQYRIPHPYWTEVRGFEDEDVERFDLGYDPFSDRCVLPLRDMHGRVLGVTYRRLDDGRPKYLHPKGFPIGRHLYGAWLLDEQKTVAVTEGQVDAVRCWSARVPAVSMMGSRLTVDQVRVLKMCDVQHVVLMLDNDSAGIGGTLQCHDALKGSGIRVSVGWYRDYWFKDGQKVKDPDSLSPQRLRKMFHGSITMVEWAAKVEQ
jgi:DNA primase